VKRRRGAQPGNKNAMAWKGSDADRLMSKVTPEPNTGCWLWTGATLARRGYGCLSVRNRTVSAHRWAWTVLRGPIPKGLSVLHKCDNPACVNAETHLFLGTTKDNTRDMLNKRRECHGARCYKAKLSAEQVAEIRALVAAGKLRMKNNRHGEVTQAALAVRFGVLQCSISAVARYATWRHG
jgi:hypothetical protein